MFFRNVTMFRFPTSLDLSALDAGLAECVLKPVGPLELSSAGFISPFGRDCEALSQRIGNAIWLTVGSENRLLPGAVVSEALAKRLAAIEKEEGAIPGPRTRRRLKDEIIVDMLPRAFVRPGRIDAVLDLDLGLIAVNTSSRKAAEGVVSEIRRALGSFPALPLSAESAARSILTGWVAGEDLPEGLAIGDECELSDSADERAKAKFTRQEVESEEIGRHLDTGMQVSRLALTLDDQASFVVGDDLVLRKFRLLDGAVDKLEHNDSDGLRAELDARFALFSAELKRVFQALHAGFTFVTPEA
ncbi:recombination-associated protein RdgC [Lysobacter sp. K5869]|uniref:recombination-associated protein RdgC n=1 Tax=Lysobacter sp. K5869 TaxID=2820808 RepID=UPI001C060378|nr:recombination-associated protein RdgC [Lysobacter sp. K5869]QWP79190.1 recombination-associated protein RdgC [Lysobacter sp. K5869]